MKISWWCDSADQCHIAPEISVNIGVKPRGWIPHGKVRTKDSLGKTCEYLLNFCLSHEGAQADRTETNVVSKLNWMNGDWAQANTTFHPFCNSFGASGVRSLSDPQADSPDWNSGPVQHRPPSRLTKTTPRSLRPILPSFLHLPFGKFCRQHQLPPPPLLKHIPLCGRSRATSPSNQTYVISGNRCAGWSWRRRVRTTPKVDPLGRCFLSHRPLVVSPGSTDPPNLGVHHIHLQGRPAPTRSPSTLLHTVWCFTHSAGYLPFVTRKHSKSSMSSDSS